MIEDFDFEMLEQFEGTPEHQVVFSQLRELEATVKARVDEETWNLIIRWEELWAQLLVESKK